MVVVSAVLKSYGSQLSDQRVHGSPVSLHFDSSEVCLCVCQCKESVAELTSCTTVSTESGHHPPFSFWWFAHVPFSKKSKDCDGVGVLSQRSESCLDLACCSLSCCYCKCCDHCSDRGPIRVGSCIRQPFHSPIEALLDGLFDLVVNDIQDDLILSLGLSDCIVMAQQKNIMHT